MRFLVLVSCAVTILAHGAIAQPAGPPPLPPARPLAPGEETPSGLSAFEKFCNVTYVSEVEPSYWDFAGPVLNVTTDDAIFAYQRFGNTSSDLPPLVLVCGFDSTMHTWPGAWLQTLALDQEVIIFDNRGQGLSVDLAPAGSLSIPGMANDTVALIEALDLGELPNLLGWSMGGMISLAAAALHGEHLNKVVVVAGSAGSLNSTPPQFVAITDLSGGGTVESDLNLYVPLLSPEAVEFACRFELESAERDNIGLNATTTAAQTTALEDYYLVDTSVWDAVPDIQNQLLLVGGERDQVVPSQDLRLVALRAPRPWLIVYPDAGHASLFQYEDSFLSILQNFLTLEAF